MKNRTRPRQQIRHLLWLLLGGVLSPLSSVHGQTYTVVGLPPELQGVALNASGQVAGYASFNGSTVHAALYSGGQLTDLGTLGGDHSEAVAINAGGQAVGDSTLSNGLTHATLWSNGQVIDLGTLPGGATSYATGINDAGQITGWSDTLQPGTSYPRPDHAFIYENGQMTDLGNISATGQFGNFSAGNAINASGEVTGWSVTDTFEVHAFLYAGGQMSDLGTLGGSESRGRAISDAGEVVGWSYLPNDAAAHAFLMNGGPMMDLGTVSGSNNSYAVGVNDAGAIVGTSVSMGSGPFLSLAGGVPVDLNTYIDTFLQVLSSVQGITNGGQILAEGTTDNFVQKPFLLTPTGGMDHHLANISTRLQIGTSDSVLIAGFIIQGPPGSTKAVIVRGIGPSLAGTGGITNPLANPMLELHDGTNAVIASNDNWKDTQQTEIEASTVAPTNDLESAIVQTLAPGAYTAILRGVNGSTGVGLVEVYDLAQASAARTVNISTRGLVGTGTGVMIGGVIITGADPVNLVVRAIGPSLGSAGVVGFLVDPTLELHDANGNVTSNDNWRDTQQDEIIADQLAPTDDRESAIAATLLPGAYTAVVSGKNNTSGVALIEFYQLP